MQIVIRFVLHTATQCPRVGFSAAERRREDHMSKLKLAKGTYEVLRDVMVEGGGVMSSPRVGSLLHVTEGATATLVWHPADGEPDQMVKKLARPDLLRVRS